MRHIFFINPTAGKKDQSERIRQEILVACENHDIDPLIFISEYAGYEREMANKMCSLFSNEDIRLYCCGGSGTLSQIVSGIDNFDHVEIACYPCGSNNDFLKCYGKNIKKFASIENLITGRVDRIDVMNMNGLRAMNLVGFGMRNHFFNPPQEYELLIDGRNYSGKYCFAACFNGSCTGGKYIPLPETKPNDGVMNVILAKDLSLFHQLRFYHRFARNKIKRIDPSLYILEAKSISVSRKGDSEPIDLYCDGDRIVAEEMTTNIEISKRRVQFVVPETVKEI